jgi:hypothetical protein
LGAGLSLATKGRQKLFEPGNKYFLVALQKLFLAALQKVIFH